MVLKSSLVSLPPSSSSSSSTSTSLAASPLAGRDERVLGRDGVSDVTSCVAAATPGVKFWRRKEEKWICLRALSCWSWQVHMTFYRTQVSGVRFGRTAARISSFFSARSHCSTHQILELSDQPFIFLQINPQLFELFDIENIWNNVLVVMNYLILFLGSKLKV